MSWTAAAATVLALAAGSAPAGAGAPADRLPAGTKILKGPLDPSGSIRFQTLPSKRGKRPRLDRFNIRFRCLDGTRTGLGYGAAPGASIRPNAKRRFRIADKSPSSDLVIAGRFNRGFTAATGTFRFEGDLVTSAGDVHCATGNLAWSAAVQP